LKGKSSEQRFWKGWHIKQQVSRHTFECQSKLKMNPRRPGTTKNKTIKEQEQMPYFETEGKLSWK
jgi:hypothetical protein